jgi:hypothetical protein
VEKTPNVMRSLSSVLLTEHYLGDQIEKNEMGGACSTWGQGKRRGVRRILVGKPEGETSWKTQA